MRSNGKRSRGSGSYSVRPAAGRSTRAQRDALRTLAMAAGPRGQTLARGETWRSASAVASRKPISGESGYVDTTGLAGIDLELPFNSTGALFLLNKVPVGAAQTNRVGKKILLKSLQFRGQAHNLSAAQHTFCTIIVVYDRRPTEVDLTFEDILNTVSTTSLNKDDNSGRLRILKREDFVMTGVTGAPNSAKELSFYLDLKNLPTVFKSTGTGGIGDIEQGALWLAILGTASGEGAGTGKGKARVRFNDV